MAFAISNIFRGVVLIEKLVTGVILWQGCICFKPSSKSSVLICMLSKKLLNICISIYTKADPLLIRKMNLKVNHIGDLLLYIKKIEMP